MLFSLLIMMIYLWPLRGLELFLKCLSVRIGSFDDRPVNSATMRVEWDALS
jgi:hypothetical protein